MKIEVENECSNKDPSTHSLEQATGVLVCWGGSYVCAPHDEQREKQERRKRKVSHKKKREKENEKKVEKTEKKRNAQEAVFFVTI